MIEENYDYGVEAKSKKYITDYMKEFSKKNKLETQIPCLAINLKCGSDNPLKDVYLEAKQVLFVLLGDCDFCFNYEEILEDLKKAVERVDESRI